jgi:hypothetical protein
MTTTTNAMPSFKVLINKVVVGRVNAVSYEQALTRALALVAKSGHSRCEVIAEGKVNLDRKARSCPREDHSFTHGRSRYPTPGFDARRAALLAEFKARQG